MGGGKRRRSTPFRLRRTPAVLLAAVVALPLFTSASGHGLAESRPEAHPGPIVQEGQHRRDRPAAAVADRAEVQAAMARSAEDQGAVLLRSKDARRLLEALARDVEVEIASPKGRRVWTVSALAAHDLPWAARRAYVRAARNSARTDPACHLSWTLLAAIGRVESDHGRYGGSVLGTDGVSRPHILGLPLNGVGPVAAIPDTDGGRLDGDTVWDRAVGPMQFIPSTWETARRDGDGDGAASPHDLDDAATAAAAYLCAGGGDLRQAEAQEAAIYRYNQSDYYVSLVRAFEAGYRTGDFSVPAPPELTEQVRAGSRKKGEQRRTKARRAEQRADRSTQPDKPTKAREKAGATGGPSPSGKPSRPVSPSQSPSPDQVPDPSPSKGASPTTSPSASTSPSLRAGSTDSPGSGPVAQELTAVITRCGPAFCLGGTVLDPGSTSQLHATAAKDFDADGVVETNSSELAGLVGEPVTMVVVPVTGGRLSLLAIDGVPLA